MVSSLNKESFKISKISLSLLFIIFINNFNFFKLKKKKKKRSTSYNKNKISPAISKSCSKKSRACSNAVLGVLRIKTIAKKI